MLTKAQCTNCGANLEVDSDKEAAICPFCGTAYIVEKAINNYNINSINAQSVYFVSDNKAEIDSRFKNAETLLKTGYYDKAYNEYMKLSELYFYDVRCHEGAMLSLARNFKNTDDLSDSQWEELDRISDVIKKLDVNNPILKKYEKFLKQKEEIEKEREIEQKNIEKRAIITAFGIIIGIIVMFTALALLVFWLSKTR